MSRKMIIEFDVSWETFMSETFEKTLAEIEQATGAKAVHIVENGPGGGWPMVDFEVEESRLEDLIEFMGYGDEMEYMKEGARPA